MTITADTELMDVADLVELADQFDDDGLDQYRFYMPEDYVVGIFGPRGSGKSLKLAYLLKNILLAHYYSADHRKITVFTNLEMYPDIIGTDNHPLPLNLNQMISFDTALQKAVMGIEEIDTWIERKRPMSTSQIVVVDFLKQLRKKWLRIAFTQQSPKIPEGLERQLDLVIYAADSFFTPWGREANIPKGTCFNYVYVDRSGAFTGEPGNTWQLGLIKAQGLWKIYNSYQTFDVLQWAKKVTIKGGETIIDTETGQTYSAYEERVRQQQKALKELNDLVSRYWRSWDHDRGFLSFVRTNDALIDDLPDKIVISVPRLRLALGNLKGDTKRQYQKDYEALRALAGSKGVAQFVDHQNVIELAKPLKETSEVSNETEI